MGNGGGAVQGLGPPMNTGLPEVGEVKLSWKCRLLEVGSCRVVTFGQSFHRVRRLEVAETVYALLEPGGSLVLISNEVEGRPRPDGQAARSFLTLRLGNSSSLISARARATISLPGTRASRPDSKTRCCGHVSAARAPSMHPDAQT
jgi:hypothetical protein